ncbi:hypothetical protein VMUT_1754 [Vulcanisaeta moutnovskia 768-28]|uniref:Uncharacterized protein n=1 Tax=Vulcanisaeta moutnovskia (strain 768-28) TaxID=985053 RepID=F0QUX3_VULM7|nr:hypothetical protein [Vulcanisaeta moutnovskia]ADY01955.1 hypothetical protein VMUT_1754 [Vulcanisaeta moutnovskia 768-28]
MAILTGLMSFTKGHGIRALSITGPKGLFVSQVINGVMLTAVINEHDYVRLDDERFGKLLFAFSPIISKVIKMTDTNYYTFLGRYVYSGERFTYEPYVDIMKTITISITKRSVRIIYGENKVNLKRTKKGYTPREMLDTLGYIIEKLHSGNA